MLMFGLGNTEILIIVLVVFVLFGGGKKIPELFTGLGKGIRSFRKSLNSDDEDASKKEMAENGQKDLTSK